MPNKIRRSITALRRTWSGWEIADSTKALWEVVPKQARDKWKTVVTTFLSSTVLSIWIVSVKAWWSNYWLDVLAVIGIVLFSVAFSVIVSARLDRRHKTSVNPIPPVDLDSPNPTPPV
ncbi:MAG: hypothetical protein V3T49_02740 [Dehalococcoidia bacterium]